jgi:hypothetical protein
MTLRAWLVFPCAQEGLWPNAKTREGSRELYARKSKIRRKEAHSGVILLMLAVW